MLVISCFCCGRRSRVQGNLQKLDIEEASADVRVVAGTWEVLYKKVPQQAGGLIDTDDVPPAKTTWLRVAGTIVNSSSKPVSSVVLRVRAEGRRSSKAITYDTDLRMNLAPGQTKEFKSGERYLEMGYIPIVSCAAAVLAEPLVDHVEGRESNLPARDESFR